MDSRSGKIEYGFHGVRLFQGVQFHEHEPCCTPSGARAIGFTRAFFAAGTLRVMVSLRKVDAAATRALMLRFYELWNATEGKGLGAASALKRAQEFVARQERWRDPKYWAAWQLWGLPD
jgi:CHAT domain-containing protein